MSGSKYYDTTAVLQVIGCILRDPSLLDDAKYFFNEHDFTNDFHRVVFGSIYNLYTMGAKHINANAIEDYLEKRLESKAIFKQGNGAEWVVNTMNEADLFNFDYYYNKVKKMTLLRNYSDLGLDLSWLYDVDNICDVKKKQQQEAYLDTLSLNDIADLIDNRILDIRATYIDDATDESVLIGDKVFEILESLEEKPEMGMPLYGKYMNTLTRGARLGKFYLRSAATGVGKSRTMIADACYLSCSKIYNSKTDSWDELQAHEPVAYIATEQDLEEVTTMALAFIADVDEEHILVNKYNHGEKERVQKAAKILSTAPLYIQEMPNFSIKDVENCIKRDIRTNKTKYIFFDYIHTSMGILKEISSAANGTRLREDNILFLFSVALKDIANQYNVFILSSTQLNEGWKTDSIPDQNLLRGAKAIADRADWGSILLDATEQDREALENIIQAKPGMPMPNVKLSVYKNRRGSYNKILLWMNADKATCRFNGLFATDYSYNLIPIKDTEIVL